MAVFLQFYQRLGAFSLMENLLNTYPNYALYRNDAQLKMMHYIGDIHHFRGWIFSKSLTILRENVRGNFERIRCKFPTINKIGEMKSDLMSDFSERVKEIIIPLSYFHRF